MKRLLFTLIALGVCLWCMRWAIQAILGDADGRIHLYNSFESRTVFLEIYGDDSKAERTKSHRIMLRPGIGHTVSVFHSGRYIIDVLDQEKWSVSIPPESEPFDVLLDIGARGEFYAFPVFFLPDDLPSEQIEKERARLKRLHKEYRFHGTTKVVLPVRIDYGLDQPVPSARPEHTAMPPPRPWSLSTPRGAARAFLEFFAVDVLSSEQEAYYVLADERRSQPRW